MSKQGFWNLVVLLLSLAACGGESVLQGARDATAPAMDAALSCPSPRVACGSACVDPQTSAAHCGACGAACGDLMVCVAGTCQLHCPVGQVGCGGLCVNLQTDNASCGACGNACAAGQVCSLGRCSTTCDRTLATCARGAGDGGAADGGGASYCADTRTDRLNCGACGNACGDGTICVDGACRVTCATGQTVCGGTCRDLRTDDAHCGACGNACPAGTTCTAGACATSCAAGQTACAGACANLQTDNAHCGACGTACAAGQVCSRGGCSTTCGAGFATCSGGAGLDGGGASYCADTATNPANCGACGTACALSHAASNGCTDGACTVVRCAADFGDCDGVASNGCETDTRASLAHCGACGRTCALPNAVPTCAAGTCQVGSCNAGAADCDRVAANGCEVNTRTDNAHCGACGTACGPGQVCSGGTCTTTCAAPLATCRPAGGSAYCANAATDPANCGACGAACSLAGAAINGCVAGVCSVVQCAAGRGNCDLVAANGCEADLTATAAHCGACGRACALPNATATCASGQCAVAACAAGYADCNRDPADGCEVNSGTDNAHCGACGRRCGAGQVCSGGTCTTTCAAPLATCGAGLGAYCADAASDPANCGACGRACSLAAVALGGCAGGACTVVRCNAGAGDCDGAADNGCEANLQTDGRHCGACGRACALPNATAACAGGACGVAACAGGFFDCNREPADGCEVNSRTDNANCGGCGVACAAGQVCSGGACGTTCAAPLATCGAAGSSFCASTATDPANCGACGNACALAHTATQGCVGGACVPAACATGFGNCDGAAANGCEADLLTSSAHCGTCGRACGGGQSCVAGSCSCPAGQTLCGGTCVDTRVSASHCGTCGNACALANASSVCAASVCTVSSCASGYADCDGAAANGCEANLQVDSTRCGGCGTSCAAGQVCSRGACGTTCASPLATCTAGGVTTCADTAGDPSNCGACGRACALANATANGCAGGACVPVTCAAGFGNCDGAAANGCEANLGNTNAHCGACGRACGGGQTCVSGACACPAGQTLCGGVCTATATDAANCGTCGRVCALANAASSCAAGACAVTGCTPGYADCDRLPATGCEVNTLVDGANCGGCGVACAAGQVCSGGSCTTTCASSLATCMIGSVTTCANTTSDPAHCGACGRACALANATSNGCVGSACVPVACASGFGNCDGAAANGCEANLLTTAAHCGACGRACAAAQTCVAGACTCPAGQTLCGGACVDPTADASNCGACGRVCSAPNATSRCVSGACFTTTCNAGFFDCDRVSGNGCEVNALVDSANCGGCGTACAAGQVCSAGRCNATCAAPLSTCNPGTASAYCANLTSDPANCQTCGNACPAGANATGLCAGARGCVSLCDAGFADCNGSAADGCETNLSSDATCGACGVSCVPSGQVCGGSSCRAPLLTAGPISPGPQAGNTSGGTAFPDVCPPGQAVVGYNFIVNSYLRQVQTVCGTLSLSATAPYTIAVAPGATLPNHGSVGGSPGSVTCPANQVAVGFTGRSGGLVDQVALRCAPLVVSASRPFTVTVGPAATQAGVGGGGGSAFGLLDCPANQVALGTNPRVGDGLDAFGLLCAPLFLR